MGFYLRRRSRRVKVVYALCAFNGICALFFGGLMIFFPVNTPLGLGSLLPAMENFPFQGFFKTLFWPGLALVLCNGVCNSIAATLFFRKNDNVALQFALVAGILLVVWNLYEFVFLPNPLAVFYGLVGIIQVFLCLHISRESRTRWDL